MDWTGGLCWHPKMEHELDDAPEDADLEAALAALEAETRLLNVAARQVEQAAGRWHADIHGLAARLTARAEARFFSESFLACDHSDCLVFVSLWGGPILAAACLESTCQQRLDHLIDTSRRFGFCGACDARCPELHDFTTVVQPIASGRLIVPVHGHCLFPADPSGPGLLR